MEAAVERAGRRPGWLLRGIGKTFLVAAAILAAYIVWLLWGTGIYQDRVQGGLREDLERRIEAAQDGPEPTAPPLPGQAYAILEIPRLEMSEVVVQGTDAESLKKGPGHYEETADPWDEAGRVGIAGHRTTYGAPFWDLELLRAGDEITLVTDRGTFAYEVSRTQIVHPSNGDVLDPSKRPTLALTTCNPRFSAAERLIVIAERVAAT